MDDRFVETWANQWDDISTKTSEIQEGMSEMG